MNPRILLLLALICIVAIPAPAPADNYMGGDVVLGGAGPRTISVTQVQASATQTTATIPPQAVAATGSVAIRTSPAGAAIAIDGVRQGISPATIPGLSPGTHTLLLTRDGYADLSVPVAVTGGQTKEYNLVMTQLAAAGTASPSATAKKTPGFGFLVGIAALGAVILARKSQK